MENDNRRRSGRRFGICMAAVLCGVLFAGAAQGMAAEAADTEKVMQLRTKGISDPERTGAEFAGDFVTYSDCYFYQERWDTVREPVLAPPTVYMVLNDGRYDRNVKKRVMDLQSVADGSALQVGVPEIAFVSAAVGGKDSDYKNGNGLRPIPEAEVNNWKLTIKNPYDEEDNPYGMRAPKVTNVYRQGGAVCFDYEDVYNTGHCYLSAVLLSKYETEVVAYDRLVDATERGNGTIAINWTGDYDENGYVLKVFAEKYNGDNMTDYISEMQYVYQGFDPDEELD